jgi:hypothetical protein
MKEGGCAKARLEYGSRIIAAQGHLGGTGRKVRAGKHAPSTVMANTCTHRVVKQQWKWRSERVSCVRVVCESGVGTSTERGGVWLGGRWVEDSGVEPFKKKSKSFEKRKKKDTTIASVRAFAIPANEGGQCVVEGRAVGR